MSIAFPLALIALAAWVYLAWFHGRFWRAEEWDAHQPVAHDLDLWPAVTAVVPARNEAEGIGEAMRSLLGQDYAGPFDIIVVDDQSDDGTAEIARAAAEEMGAADRLTVLTGSALPEGWTGKLWAVSQGIAEARSRNPVYLWLTDADIRHQPDCLADLVTRSEKNGLALATLMVKLNCTSFAERFMIPAFVYFFAMLYPFGWVNDAAKKTAAAAGGSMLVRRETLEQAGGIERIRSQVIDDVALSRLLKPHGPIWLALTERSYSLRRYADLAEVGFMISRSAYTQLGYSVWKLVGTLVGMTLIFVLPVVFALFADGGAQWFGLAAWIIMALTLQPVLGLYRLTPFWGLALPAIAAVYLWFTFLSARAYWQGRGAMWKGRAQAVAPHEGS